jgi:hypothetical protein
MSSLHGCSQIEGCARVDSDASRPTRVNVYLFTAFDFMITASVVFEQYKWIGIYLVGRDWFCFEQSIWDQLLIWEEFDILTGQELNEEIVAQLIFTI